MEQFSSNNYLDRIDDSTNEPTRKVKLTGGEIRSCYPIGRSTFDLSSLNLNYSGAVVPV